MNSELEKKDSNNIEMVTKLNNLGYHIIAGDSETNKILEEKNIFVSTIEGENHENIKNKKIDLVLDLTNNHESNYKIRRSAVDYNVSLMTNVEQIKLGIVTLISKSNSNIRMNRVNLYTNLDMFKTRILKMSRGTARWVWVSSCYRVKLSTGSR